MDNQLILFSAPWCRPCSTMKPIVSKAINELPIELENINIDEDTNLAVKYKVRQIPTLLIIHNNEEIDRLVGSHSLQEIKEFISKLTIP